MFLRYIKQKQQHPVHLMINNIPQTASVLQFLSSPREPALHIAPVSLNHAIASHILILQKANPAIFSVCSGEDRKNKSHLITSGSSRPFFDSSGFMCCLRPAKVHGRHQYACRFAGSLFFLLWLASGIQNFDAVHIVGLENPNQLCMSWFGRCRWYTHLPLRVSC